MRALLAALLALLLTSNSASDAASSPPAQLSAALVDTKVILPKGVPDRAYYVRYYLLKTIRTTEDLPFTTSPEFELAKPRLVWLALFIRTPSIFTSAPATVREIAGAQQFPQVVHGGCVAVNTVVDARTGATLGSWCNVVDVPTSNGRPRRIPTYMPRGSPIHDR
jgi:hypothetical protein